MAARNLDDAHDLLLSWACPHFLVVKKLFKIKMCIDNKAPLRSDLNYNDKLEL